MAEDVKIQLGIDVEALQRSASEATNILSKQFSQMNIGPQLLGSGIAPTQGAQTAGQKDTIRGVIDALERIERTLTIGFTSIAGGVYTGGGGGGGGAGPGGGAGAPPLAPPTPGTGVAGGPMGIAGQVLSRAGDLAAALMPSSMKMFMGGFYGTDIMGFAHNLVSQIPIAGRLLGAITGPFHQVMQQNDEFKNMQYELFRDTGEDAMNVFTDLWEDDTMREQYLKRYGFSRQESQQLLSAGYRRGLNTGGQGIESVLNMQGGLGLGMEAAETAGALRKAGGAAGQEQQVFANAIGVAVSTGLERGRWGEMLTMWQRAAQSSVDTDIAWKEVAAQQQFIGGLGGRFRGDTAAAQSMDQALKQMAASTESPLSLRAAMQLTGGDYFAATSRMARAAQVPDTQLEEANIDQLMGLALVQQYMSMPDGPEAEATLKRAAGLGAIYFPMLGQLKIETLLKARKATTGKLFKGPAAEAVGIGQAYTTGAMPLPETALGPRRSQTEAQRPSGISSIQENQPLVKGGAAGALKRSVDDRFRRMEAGDPSAMPTMEELRSGQMQIQFSPGIVDMPPPVTQGSAQVTQPTVQSLGELSPGDIQGAAAIAGIPAETMRSWFRIESGGRVGTLDAGGAVRGFGQLNREEAAMVGVAGKDFERLSTDKAFSLQKSAELAKRYLARARQQAPADWSEDDILHLMKLQHGGVGTAQFIMQDYQRRFGKMPKSWDELFQGEKGFLPGGPGTGQLGALLNANKIEVTIKVDQTGRVAGTTVRQAATGPVTSPGQLVGGPR